MVFLYVIICGEFKNGYINAILFHAFRQITFYITSKSLSHSINNLVNGNVSYRF